MVVETVNEEQTGLTVVNLFPGDLVARPCGPVLTTLLGSCVAVALMDKTAHVAGLNHFLLAEPPSPATNAAHYGCTAIPELIRQLEAHGASRTKMQAGVFGGGGVVEALSPSFDIGAENVRVARTCLEAHGIPIFYEDVGGAQGRKLIFETALFRISVARLKKGAA